MERQTKQLDPLPRLYTGLVVLAVAGKNEQADEILGLLSFLSFSNEHVFITNLQ